MDYRNKVPKVIKSKKRKHPLEKTVEAYYKKQIRLLGGESWKFTSPNRRSVTDQLTLIEGRVIFVEVKAAGNDLSKKQASFREKVLTHKGEHATVVGHEGVDAFIEELRSELKIHNKMLNLLRMSVQRFKSKFGK